MNGNDPPSQPVAGVAAMADDARALRGGAAHPSQDGGLEQARLASPGPAATVRRRHGEGGWCA